MATFNKVILMGNLTRDPELRYTPKGAAVARIGLALNRVWKTESGETREEVTYVDVDAFGRQAETIAQYLKKGSPILVEGRLRLHTWEDKQTNQKQSKLRVDLESFKFVGPAAAREGAPPEPARQRGAPTTPETSSPAEVETPPPEDDVPF
jgi:single-strand DNA-binding protein